MENIDAAYNSFTALLEEIKDYDKTIFSEQDNRIKIIDRILVEILGYQYQNISTEPLLALLYRNPFI